MPEPTVLPWGDMPYDRKMPSEVVDDYALVRGDLSASYAREQLALWIERYAAHVAAEALRRAAMAPEMRLGGHSGVSIRRLRVMADAMESHA